MRLKLRVSSPTSSCPTTGSGSPNSPRRQLQRLVGHAPDVGAPCARSPARIKATITAIEQENDRVNPQRNRMIGARISSPGRDHDQHPGGLVEAEESADLVGRVACAHDRAGRGGLHHPIGGVLERVVGLGERCVPAGHGADEDTPRVRPPGRPCCSATTRIPLRPENVVEIGRDLEPPEHPALLVQEFRHQLDGAVLRRRHRTPGR